MKIVRNDGFVYVEDWHQEGVREFQNLFREKHPDCFITVACLDVDFFGKPIPRCEFNWYAVNAGAYLIKIQAYHRSRTFVEKLDKEMLKTFKYDQKGEPMAIKKALINRLKFFMIKIKPSLDEMKIEFEQDFTIDINLKEELK